MPRPTIPELVPVDPSEAFSDVSEATLSTVPARISMRPSPSEVGTPTTGLPSPLRRRPEWPCFLGPLAVPTILAMMEVAALVPTFEAILLELGASSEPLASVPVHLLGPRTTYVVVALGLPI